MNDKDINIIFTTIHGLANIISEPKENSLSIDDFKANKCVLLADEGHHLNSETKKKRTKEEDKNIKSWEAITRKVFNAHEENYLLEFTATAGIKENTKLREKYDGKLLFDYPISKFYTDKYSKEIYLLQSNLSKIDRAILAILLSQYRKNVFTDELKQNFKPTILFKSKNNKKCDEFYEEFLRKIDNLDINDVRKLKNHIDANDAILNQVFKYFIDKDPTLKSLISEIQREFSKEKCVIIHSGIKDKKNISSIISKLNDLENYRNPIRSVFATDMLNEGWDVKNLYDIVRLYDTNTTKEVTQEAQLIGRGARYYPFEYDDSLQYQRKFDNQADHVLKICEELYYHSHQDIAYISNLKEELNRQGVPSDNQIQEIHLELKSNFIQTDFYKEKSIYINEPLSVSKEEIVGFNNYFDKQEFEFEINSSDIKIEKHNAEESPATNKMKYKSIQMVDFDKRLIYHVFNKKRGFYNFENLLIKFPNLGSKKTFIESPQYLGNISICFEGIKQDIDNLTTENKMKGLEFVFSEIEKLIKENAVQFKGSEEFYKKKIQDVFQNKTLYKSTGSNVIGIGQSNKSNNDRYLNIIDEDWYFFNEHFGTDQENYLVKFIHKIYQQLENNFNEIYLIRNEEFFKIYDFKNGEGFCPDFVLFLIKDNDPTHLQIFIEPKGSHLIEHDQWKNAFLLNIESKCIIIDNNEEYKIWGLPFYNNKPEIENVFHNSLIKVVNHSL